MGMLSDFVVANHDSGPAIGDTERPSEQWPCLEGWKGVETIKLSTLHFSITGQAASVDDVVDLSATFELSGGNPDEGPWVLKFPAVVVSSIAGLTEETIGPIAAKWAETEELQMDGWSPEDAGQFISQLHSLASRTISEGKSLYLWISL